MNPQLSGFILIAVLHIGLPAIAWTVLYRRHDQVAVSAWCFGGLLYGMGVVLNGLYGSMPSSTALVIANFLAFLGYFLRGVALRREFEAPHNWIPAAGVWLAFTVGHWIASVFATHQAPALLVSIIGNLIGAAWLAWLAKGLFKRRGFRSARMVSIAYGLLAAAWLVRATFVVLHWTDEKFVSNSVDYLLLFTAGLVAALYGNLAFMGLVLESDRQKELQTVAELAREQERRSQSELRIAEQAMLLQEKSALLVQREEMVAVMAHEIRQPLNNASAALQSAVLAISSPGREVSDVLARIHRAGAVLSEVTAALDNTLTDAVALAPNAVFVRQDIDVDTLLELSIADITPLQRERVKFERLTDTRTASMNQGLMRLAVRNLVVNALSYTPADSPVVIRVSDLDDPLALVIDVCDEGPGFSPEVVPRLFTRGARGADAHGLYGHGLGLYIVRRVMTLHGGEVQILPNSPKGLKIRLVISQGITE